MKEIIITVKPDGTTEIEAKGYKGRSCLEATKPFEEKLGIVEKRKMKPVALVQERSFTHGVQDKIKQK